MRVREREVKGGRVGRLEGESGYQWKNTQFNKFNIYKIFIRLILYIKTNDRRGRDEVSARVSSDFKQLLSF